MFSLILCPRMFSSRVYLTLGTEKNTNKLYRLKFVYSSEDNSIIKSLEFLFRSFDLFPDSLILISWVILGQVHLRFDKRIFGSNSSSTFWKFWNFGKFHFPRCLRVALVCTGTFFHCRPIRRFHFPVLFLEWIWNWLK